MKNIRISLLSGKEDLVLGIVFDPDVIIDRMKGKFENIVLDEIDEFTRRLIWAQNQLDLKDSEHNDSFLKNIIDECNYNLPAISFTLKQGQYDVKGIVFKYGLRFFGDKEKNNGEIPENILNNIREFLNSFQLEIT